MKIDNRRKFQRIDFDGKVDLQLGNSHYDCCQVKNLSLTGLYVSGNFLLRKSQNCQVKIFHDETSGINSLKASAKVAWRNDDGVGLQFTAMTFEDYLLLQTALIDNAPEPDRILRELPRDCPFFISSL